MAWRAAAVAILFAGVLAALAPGGQSSANTARHFQAVAARSCPPPRGIVRLRATHVSCGTARAVAKAARKTYKARFHVRGRTWTCRYHQDFTARCHVGRRSVWMEIYDGPAKPIAHD
jgi:hypothetical protein